MSKRPLRSKGWSCAVAGLVLCVCWVSCQNPIWLQGLPCDPGSDCGSPLLQCIQGTCIDSQKPRLDIEGKSEEKGPERSQSRDAAPDTALPEPGEYRAESTVDTSLTPE